MKIVSKNMRIVTYGDAFRKLSKPSQRGESIRGVKIFRRWNVPEVSPGDGGQYLLIFSEEWDDAFSHSFRKHATQTTKLLVLLNEDISADRLVSRILDLQIRASQRCYLMNASFGKTGREAFVVSLLRRLSTALTAEDKEQRIFDARIEKGILYVVSPDFTRLKIPISDIPQLQNAARSRVENFEIDEDGSFIFWPELDLHLGWSQLQQIVNPAAARKALQKSRQFNIRYGKAVRKVREAAGLKPADIVGLSEKQLGRIESGECRLTTNAIESLSRAHRWKINEYLQKLAEALAA